MKKHIASLVLIISILSSVEAAAAPLLMVRVNNKFPETMVYLQAAVTDQGYKVSRVQRVDVGLTKTGHKTDAYRLVFFGKAEEIRELSARYPELIPYLPLKIVIFAEGEDTLLLAANMHVLLSFYSDKNLQPYFDRWAADIGEILETTRLSATR